jgi:hypothetical protein
MSVIHKNFNSIWNKNEFPDQWKEDIIGKIDKNDDETDCTNYHMISQLSTACKDLSYVLVSVICSYIGEVTSNYQCEIGCKRLTTDQIFCTYQILERKCNCNGIVHQPVIDFKNIHDFS